MRNKHDLICHVAKVKAATSAHPMADVIPLLVYLIFESNASIKPKENIVYTQSDKQNKIRNIYRTLIEPRWAYGRAVKK